MGEHSSAALCQWPTCSLPGPGTSPCRPHHLPGQPRPWHLAPGTGPRGRSTIHGPRQVAVPPPRRPTGSQVRLPCRGKRHRRALPQRARPGHAQHRCLQPRGHRELRQRLRLPRGGHQCRSRHQWRSTLYPRARACQLPQPPRPPQPPQGLSCGRRCLLRRGRRAHGPGSRVLLPPGPTARGQQGRPRPPSRGISPRPEGAGGDMSLGRSGPFRQQRQQRHVSVGVAKPSCALPAHTGGPTSWE